MQIAAIAAINAVPAAMRGLRMIPLESLTYPARLAARRLGGKQAAPVQSFAVIVRKTALGNSLRHAGLAELAVDRRWRRFSDRLAGAFPPLRSRHEGEPDTMAKAARGSAAPRINIGISEADRAAIAGGLSKLLADTYTLYLTTHNFHWNVTGPMFNTLHLMFMAQYTELWNAVDPIAERIRSLGHPAPGSYAQFGGLSSIKDVPETPPKALEMVRILVEGHEAVARTARASSRSPTRPATSRPPTC